MAVLLRVASNAAASSWTDITGVVDLPTLRAAGQAFDGQIGQGGVDLDDDAGTAAIPGFRVWELWSATSGGILLERGRIGVRDLERGVNRTEDAHEKDVTLWDCNADLSRIGVHGWERPSETGRARVLAVLADFLDGDPRASTVIGNAYVRDVLTRTMPAKTYTNANPMEVIEDCAAVEAKIFFVVVNDDGTMDLFYDVSAYTGYASSLSITDVDPDGVTEFAPIGARSTEDPSELFSHVRMTYGTGSASVVANDSGVATAHDYMETIFHDSNAVASTAQDRVDTFLDIHDEEEISRRCAIRIPASALGDIRRGQTISYRAAATGDLTPVTRRIAQLTYEPPLEDGQDWTLHLELDWPLKIGQRYQRPKPPPAGADSDGGPVIPVPSEYCAIDFGLTARGSWVSDSDAADFFPGTLSVSGTTISTSTQPADAPPTPTPRLTVNVVGTGFGTAIENGGRGRLSATVPAPIASGVVNNTAFVSVGARFRTTASEEVGFAIGTFDAVVGGVVVSTTEVGASATGGFSASDTVTPGVLHARWTWSQTALKVWVWSDSDPEPAELSSPNISGSFSTLAGTFDEVILEVGGSLYSATVDNGSPAVTILTDFSMSGLGSCNLSMAQLASGLGDLIASDGNGGFVPILHAGDDGDVLTINPFSSTGLAYEAPAGGGSPPASDVTFAPAGTIASTDVQLALEEVSADHTAHLADATDAHDASAVSVVDAAGFFTATEVEGALEELGTLTALAHVHTYEKFVAAGGTPETFTLVTLPLQGPEPFINGVLVDPDDIGGADNQNPEFDTIVGDIVVIHYLILI